MNKCGVALQAMITSEKVIPSEVEGFALGPAPKSRSLDSLSLARDDKGKLSLARDDKGKLSLDRDDKGKLSLARDDKPNA